MMDPAQIDKLRMSAQLALERTCPGIVQIDEEEYICATRGLGSVNTLTENGQTYDFDIVFRVRKNLLPDAPAIGSTLIWKEAEYRVQKVPLRPDDPAWYIGCSNPNQ